MGRVMAVLIRNESAMPGKGCTMPNPVSDPSPTQPDQTATNAGSASRITGHDRTGFPRPTTLSTGTGAGAGVAAGTGVGVGVVSGYATPEPSAGTSGAGRVGGQSMSGA